MIPVPVLKELTFVNMLVLRLVGMVGCKVVNC